MERVTTVYGTQLDCNSSYLGPLGLGCLGPYGLLQTVVKTLVP